MAIVVIGASLLSLYHLARAGETADDRSSSPAKHVCGSGDDGPAYDLCDNAICSKLLRPWLSKNRDCSEIERHKSMAALTDADVGTAGGRELGC
jgi:hypothetical protein